MIDALLTPKGAGSAADRHPEDRIDDRPKGKAHAILARDDGRKLLHHGRRGVPLGLDKRRLSVSPQDLIHQKSL